MTQSSTPVIASEARQSMPEEDDEISLLDLLQVVADNLRLLILGPLAAGAGHQLCHCKTTTSDK